MVDTTRKSFKQIHKVAIWIGFFLILFSMMAFVKADHSVLESRTVRIGVYQNKPKIFLDENGNADGFFIDLIKEIAKQEDWTLEFVSCEFDECLAALVEGQIDLMPDVAYSPQRDEIYDFHHIPAAESWSRVYTNPNSKIHRIDQLNGKRVAALSGSIQQTVLKETMSGYGFNVEIVPVSSLEEAFTKVADGSADAAVANHFFGDYYYETYGLVNTSIIFNASTLYYATRQDSNHDLLEAIDKHLGIWRDDPNSIYTTLLNHWL